MGAKDMLAGRLKPSAKFSDKQVTGTLNVLVEQGVSRGASDIHIEPHDNLLLVRFRIDGALRGVHKLPRQAASAVLAQLKTLAGADPQEIDTPQEGSYQMGVNGKTVGVHLSTMPVFGGEKAVLHLHLERGKPLGLEQLGFWGDGLAALQNILAQPHGLVLAAGPRHSGRASTLFSLLDALNSPLVSIATVEEHYKHRLPGVQQTYLGAGHLSTLQALQAALKQDPNIVMLSNLPDSGTAELAVHAATTGHLLLAGMYADSSVAAVLRLRATGVEPFLLVTALRAGVGQRLVRTLCPDCRERYLLSREEQQELAKSFGIASANAFKRVHELERAMAPTIFGDVKQLSSTPTAVTHLWRASSVGCDTCDRTGYTGRTAIVEILTNTPGLQKVLLAPELPSAAALQAAAVKDGFVPMALDGLVKALRGQTTIAEVLHALAPGAA